MKEQLFGWKIILKEGAMSLIIYMNKYNNVILDLARIGSFSEEF